KAAATTCSPTSRKSRARVSRAWPKTSAWNSKSRPARKACRRPTSARSDRTDVADVLRFVPTAALRRVFAFLAALRRVFAYLAATRRVFAFLAATRRFFAFVAPLFHGQNRR